MGISAIKAIINASIPAKIPDFIAIYQPLSIEWDV